MVSKKILVKLGFIEDGTDVSIDISSKEQILCERYALKLSQLHLFKTLEQN